MNPHSTSQQAETTSPDTSCNNLPDTISAEVASVLKNLEPEQRQVIEQSINAILQQETFSGPIPHPRLLQGYEDIQSGFAERIVRMAEQQQEHRIRCEQKMIDGSISESKRGQWLGFSIAVLFLAVATALALLGHPTLAGIIAGTTLISLVSVFVTNRPSRKNNEKQSHDDD